MMDGGGGKVEDGRSRVEDGPLASVRWREETIHAVTVHRFPVSSVLRFIGTPVRPASTLTTTADVEVRHPPTAPSYGVGMTNTLSATGSPRSCS
jgi:hypothetical protein